MRIFVTGGTGFIGAHFLKLALEGGHEVFALRRPGSRPVIRLDRQPKWHEDALDEVPAAVLEKCDALVHFAAQGVSPQATDWNLAFKVNVCQSLRLFATAESVGVPHIIASGSCLEYGRGGERYHRIPPDAPLEPIGPYAASKAAFSLAMQALARSSISAFTLLRPFHLYGLGQHQANFWPALRRAALAGEDFPMTGGAQVRDYMPVGAAAARFLEVTTCGPPPSGYHVENIGSGCAITLAEFATQWWEKFTASGSLLIGKIPYRTDEIMRFVPEIGKRFDSPGIE